MSDETDGLTIAANASQRKGADRRGCLIPGRKLNDDCCTPCVHILASIIQTSLVYLIMAAGPARQISPSRLSPDGQLQSTPGSHSRRGGEWGRTGERTSIAYLVFGRECNVVLFQLRTRR
jgi:hypothetical protein